MFGLIGWQAKLGEYLIVILVVAGVVFGVYHKGGVDKENEIAVEQAKVDKKQQEKYDKIAADYETLKNTRQQNVNTITHEITRITDKPIYNVSCIDSDGRMLINDALAGRKYSGSTDTGVPTTATTGR